MVSFELGKEIKKDVFRLVTSVDSLINRSSDQNLHDFSRRPDPLLTSMAGIWI